MRQTCIAVLIAGWIVAGLPPPTALAQVPATAVGDIAGNIRDMSTGQPLYPGNVLILGTSWGAMSLEDGTFMIQNVPLGTYDLKVQMMGYEDRTISGVEVREGQRTRVTFEMKGQIVAVIPEVQVTGQRKLIDKNRTGTSHHVSAEDIADLPVDDFEEVIGLKADRARRQEIVDVLERRLMELRLASRGIQPVVLRRLAAKPDHPTMPRWGTMLPIGAGVGLIVGLAWALWRRVRASPSRAEATGQAPPGESV